MLPQPALLNRDNYLLFAINIVGLAWAVLAAWAQWGVWSAYACVGITSVMYLGQIAWRRHDILVRLLIFGVAAGFTELGADWWLVSITKTLHYAAGGFFLIDSPAYMPMSWAGILLSMGFLGWLVARAHGMWSGVAVAAGVTGVYVPTFEALAHYAGWWSYSNCAMFGVVPWYIIIGETVVGAAMPPLVCHILEKRGPVSWIGAGVAAGLWIWAAYAIAMVATT